MRSGFIFGGFAIVVACGQASDKPPKVDNTAQKAPQKAPPPPLRLEFADCTPPDAPAPVVAEDVHAHPGAHPGAPPDQPTKKGGTLDKDLIRRAIRRELPKIQRCYEQKLAQIPSLQGTLHERFVIGADGRVTSSSTRGLDPAIGTCVDAIVKTIQFPAPVGGPVEVNYPFEFRTAGADLGSNTGQEHAAATMRAEPVEHVVGASSPLASARAAIETCIRAAALAPGTIAMTLTFGATNDATITLEGSHPPALVACLSALKIARPPGEVASERCSFSFGP